MQVVTLILNRTECLEALLEALLENHISGATILESTGMMRMLDAHADDMPMFGMMRALFDPERKSSKTVFMVLRDEQVETVRKLVDRVTGGLNRPDTGILFSVPTLFVDGLGGASK